MNDRNGSWLDRDNSNALNLFRLILAASVIFTHAWNLSGSVDPFVHYLGQSWPVGSAAVDGFFIISGFLIVGSYCSPTSSTERYLRSRILRIVPGFFASVAFSLLIAAAAAGGAGFSYLHSIHPQRALFQVVTLHADFLNTDLAFSSNPYPHVANNSLWTIPIEFACYLAVALAGSLGLLRKKGWIVPFLAVALVLYAVTEIRTGNSFTIAWRFVCTFGFGGAVYLFRGVIPRSGVLASVCAIALCLSLAGPNTFQPAIPLFGTYLIFFAAFNLPEACRRVGSRHDISYGIYLYAFPLQQLYYRLAVAGWLPSSPVANALVAGLATVGVAWLSWLYIESPLQRLGRAWGPSGVNTPILGMAGP